MLSYRKVKAIPSLEKLTSTKCNNRVQVDYGKIERREIFLKTGLSKLSNAAGRVVIPQAKLNSH